MKAYCSIGISGESWSICLIRRDSLLVHVAYPQILGTNGLVVVVVVVVVDDIKNKLLYLKTKIKGNEI